MPLGHKATAATAKAPDAQAWPPHLWEGSAAVDLRTTDVLLADVQGECHCNTPIVGEPGRYERLSVIAYCRADLAGRGAPAGPRSGAGRRSTRPAQGAFCG